MLSKVIFENGKSVSSEFLDEIQLGTVFDSGNPRDNFYDNPDASDHAGWPIGVRDGLKDWEIADPREEAETNIGRLAHDGIVLNNYNPDTLEKVWGPPTLRETEVGSGVFGVWVEGGKFISTAGLPIEWNTQFVQLVSPTVANFIYIDEEKALEDIEEATPVKLSIASSLPSVSIAHIPLAKIVPAPSGTSLAVGPNGSVVGTGYVDLRPNVYVGNLNSYPRTLRNTEIIGTSYIASSWERVVANTAAGSIVIQTPTNPTDSDRIAIVDISSTFHQFPIVIRPAPGQQINGSTDDWIINVRDAHVELFYNEDTTQWKFEETPGGDCNPTLGTFLSCGGKEFIGLRTAEECPDGESIPAVYPDTPSGVYSYEVSSSKCYKEYFDSVALYSNGDGGIIQVKNAPRCAKDGVSFGTVGVRNIIYVDGAIGDDSLENSGFDQTRPFRTLERALISGVRESRRGGTFNDRFDRIVIKLAPGDYYVDNSPGSNSIPGLTENDGLIQRIDSSFTILERTIGDRTITITIDSLNTNSNRPPLAFNLGRVLYSELGGVGTIVHIRKRSNISSLWDLTLEYVKDPWNIGDKIYYDNLSIVNPSTGGIIIPRGISITGENLRKVRIHPMYVPELDPVETNPQTVRSAIFKVTGSVHVEDLTFTDNLQFPRTHNTLTSIEFASENEIFGGGGEVSYYAKLNSLFADYDNWSGDGLEALPAETTIVAPVAGTKALRHIDAEENLTGVPLGDSRNGAPIAFPGAAQMVFTGSGDPTPYDLPDINSVRSSSPYVYNCSVRSIFGLNGLHADGARVSGFKSMVTANFTQVSLQVDPNCFAESTYFLDPPTNKESGFGKQYRVSPADPNKYRHFGFKATNDGFIQIVSCFVIGNADHFYADTGGDVSITNSCSDFGDISLRAKGYKGESFSQDEGIPNLSYSGTKALQIIPPLPLSYDPLPNGREATLVDQEVNSTLIIDLEKTENYIIANKTVGDQAPSVIRFYVKNSDLNNPFTLGSPPTAKSIAFGQYSYTTKLSEGVYTLSGGTTYLNRKRFYVSGFDEFGNSILYVANYTPSTPGNPGWDELDDSSKIFIWDSGEEAWYVNVTTSGILEETTDGDGDGFLLKRLNYAFRYKLLSSPSPSEAVYAGIDFIFDSSTVRIIRAADRRTDRERVYKVVLDGFLKEAGLRKPQPFYVLEKQVAEAGYPLNGSIALQNNPLIISEVTQYDKYFDPSITGILPNPGKYVVAVTQSSEGRKVLAGEYIPKLNYDEPELSEDPDESLTKEALELMLERSGVYYSDTLAPSVDFIDIKTEIGASSNGFLIGLRRPSIIRASGHTWEWAGYLNYDTSLPIFQGDPLEQDVALAKILVEETGGRVYATGMNEEGSYYIGTTIFDLRSGEQFAIPLTNDPTGNQSTNQVFNAIVVRNSLVMQDNSDMVFGNNTDIFFSPTTRFKSLTTGDITAGPNAPLVYASTTRAGLVQLADTAAVRGALGAGAAGLADKLAVPASVLAQELKARFENALQAGPGISVTSQTVELPGGDPLDPNDNITQYTISADSTSFGGYLPIGGIIMWNGVTVPTNYALCNGANGTPDLRNRFVVSIGSNYALGAQGGEAQVTLTTAQMPSHTHGGTISSAGDHTHSGSIDSAGDHSHGITDPGHIHVMLGQQDASFGTGDTNVGDSNAPDRVQSSYDTLPSTTGITINNAGAHTHTATVNSSGSHTHIFTSDSAGSGQSHNNLPPYYALAFIQRIL